MSQRCKILKQLLLLTLSYRLINIKVEILPWRCFRMQEKHKNVARVICFLLALMFIVPTVMTLFFN